MKMDLACEMTRFLLIDQRILTWDCTTQLQNDSVILPSARCRLQLCNQAGTQSTVQLARM